MDVAQAIQSRRSCRLFLDKPVERALLEEVCRLACLAPSALNLQPWLLTVVHGPELKRLSRRLLQAFEERRLGCVAEADGPLGEPYQSRRKRLSQEVGPALQATTAPWADYVNQGSLSFYGAPATVMVSGQAGLAQEGRLDLGLLVGWLLLAGQEKGLATCPIGLVSRYGEVIQDALNLPPDRPVVLAVAVGHADPAAPVNRVNVSRAPLGEVLRWYP